MVTMMLSNEKALPTPIRATTEEMASERWCHAFAFIRPLPSFSPALFVIQYNLLAKKANRSSFSFVLISNYLLDLGLRVLVSDTYPSLTDTATTVMLSARTGCSRSIP